MDLVYLDATNKTPAHPEVLGGGYGLWRKHDPHVAPAGLDPLAPLAPLAPRRAGSGIGRMDAPVGRRLTEPGSSECAAHGAEDVD